MGDHDNTEPLQALSHALFVAARDGNLAAFTAADDEAVFTAADPIAATKGWSLLHIAVEGNHDELVHHLTERGLDVNALDADEDTPLHYAAFWGHTACVGWLLAADAKLEILNKYQWTPYDVAVRRNQDEVASLLQDEMRHRTSLGLNA